jgi:hypothetical protein
MKIITILCLIFFNQSVFAINSESSFENELKSLENGELAKEEKLLQNAEAVNLLSEMEQTTDEITDDAVSVNMSAIKREPAIIESARPIVDSNYNLIIPQKKPRVRSR